MSQANKFSMWESYPSSPWGVLVAILFPEDQLTGKLKTAWESACCESRIFKDWLLTPKRLSYQCSVLHVQRKQTVLPWDHIHTVLFLTKRKGSRLWPDNKFVFLSFKLLLFYHNLIVISKKQLSCHLNKGSANFSIQTDLQRNACDTEEKDFSFQLCNFHFLFNQRVIVVFQLLLKIPGIFQNL